MQSDVRISESVTTLGSCLPGQRSHPEEVCGAAQLEGARAGRARETGT